MFVSGTGGLKVKFRAGQIVLSAATAVTFRKELCCPGAMTRKWPRQLDTRFGVMHRV